MNENIKAFIDEGMKSYKKASEVAALFRGEIENILKKVLNEHRGWGPFEKQTLKQSQSTKYWTEFPYINANVSGQLYGKDTTIRIGINWMGVSDDYPTYEVRFYEEKHPYKENMKTFDWDDRYSFDEHLTYSPDPKDLNIERDFNELIIEFVRFMNSIN